jgi:excisionase family DNA binding protein
MARKRNIAVDARAEVENGASSVFGSVDELAQELGICRQSAYSGLRSGEIPSIRVGKRFVLPKAAIREWMRTAGRTKTRAAL